MYTEPLVTISLQEYQDLKNIQKEHDNSQLKDVYKKALCDIVNCMVNRNNHWGLGLVNEIFNFYKIAFQKDQLKNEVKIFYLSDGD